MHVLVTGGAGYIGSSAAAALLEAGHTVTVFDSLVKGYRAAVPQGVEFIQGDLADDGDLQDLFHAQSFDAILHFAAFIEAGESMKDPGRFFQNNFTNSINLLDAACAAGVRQFVFSSSAGVYASKDQPLREDDPLGPASVYGQTKLMVEQALEWYRAIHGLRFAALRYFNAAGATPIRGEAHQPESHLIPLVLKTALGQRESISIFGTDYPTPDCTAIRDYIHISDLVSAHLLALEALTDREKIICNLGTGHGYSVREVIDAASEVTGREIKVVEAERRPGDAARLVACADLACSILGWKPEHPDLRDMIASAWEWHCKHPEGYSKDR
jgi:UDP-glucose 4-epimerase